MEQIRDSNHGHPVILKIPVQTFFSLVPFDAHGIITTTHDFPYKFRLTRFPPCLLIHHTLITLIIHLSQIVQLKKKKVKSFGSLRSQGYGHWSLVISGCMGGWMHRCIGA